MAAVKIVNERWEREGLIDINQWPSYQAAYDEWSEEVHFVIETFIQNIKVGP